MKFGLLSHGSLINSLSGFPLIGRLTSIDCPSGTVVNQFYSSIMFTFSLLIVAKYFMSFRYEKEGKPCQLSAVDIFVSTVDPLKEPPLVTANTVLSILAVDYPVDKVTCYVSDDGAAMLTFEALSETTEFAKKWIPFCKKYNIEPRAPESYFSQNIDYLQGKVLTSFIKERRAMKVSYHES